MELDGLSVTEHSCGPGFSQYKTETADCGLRTVDWVRVLYLSP